MMRDIFGFAAMLAGLFLFSSPPMAEGKQEEVAAATSTTMKTVKDVWNGYDPRKEDLEIEIIKETTDEIGVMKEMYFTGETINGEKIRVYGIYGAPVSILGAPVSTSQKIPGILHIHGGGQTAAPDWVKFWNKRGYACMTLDYCGDWGQRKEFTKWGNYKVGNMAQCGAGRFFEPNVTASPFYHWTLISRRAITVLERQPGVDAGRIGIFGISVGGSLVWPVAGTDKRVKAAVPIYGNGWDSYTGYGAAGDEPTTLPDDKMKLWRATMASEAYAPYIECPVLFMSATNDHHGFMDRGYDTLGRIDEKYATRQIFTPWYTHHIEPTEGIDLPLFMDWCLRDGKPFPKSPQADISIGEDGVPMLTVKIDSPRDVTSASLYYAEGNDFSVTRFWRTADAARAGSKWVAPLPILNDSISLYGFANVTYKGGIKVSSNLAKVIPAQIRGMIPARATDEPSLLISDFSKGIGEWVFGAAYTDPTISETYLKSGPGPDGRMGLTMNTDFCKGSMYAATSKTGDPKWKGPDGAKLNIMLWGEKSDQMKIVLTENQWRFEGKEYSAEVGLAGGNAWQDVTLGLGDFKTKEGKSPDNWSKVNRVELRAEDLKGKAPVIAEVKWVK